MSVDKLVDSSQLNTDLTTVANAIRTKGGTAAQLSFPGGMAQAVAAMQTVRSGTFTPTTTNRTQTVPVGASDFTHFLIVSTTLLSNTETATARTLAIRYFDMSSQYPKAVAVYNANDATSTAVASAGCGYNQYDGNAMEITLSNNSVILYAASNHPGGVFIAGKEYQWFAW